MWWLLLFLQHSEGQARGSLSAKVSLGYSRTAWPTDREPTLTRLSHPCRLFYRSVVECLPGVHTPAYGQYLTKKDNLN